MPDQIQRTRLTLTTIFNELDPTDDEFCETVMIRDGQYCGHRFSRGDYSAVWFFEENEVKIYDADRKLIRVETLCEPTVPIRRAA